jgi:hypothetical protein
MPATQKLVRIGFHGTSFENAAAIAREGIKASTEGLTGPRIYTSSQLKVSTFFALRTRIVNNENLDSEAVAGKYDYICHLFSTIEDVKSLKLRILSKKQLNEVVQATIRGLMTHPDSVLVSKQQTDFPASDASKLIPFCEPLPSYKSILNYIRHMVSLKVRDALLPFSDTSLVKQYMKMSKFGDLKTIDYQILARLHSAKTGSGETPPACIFCHLTAESNGIRVISDSRPGASIHLLAIPKTHQPTSVLELTKEDIPLIRNLRLACQEMLHSKGLSANDLVENVVYGFHIPPFISVNHLHLHCLVLPFKPEVAFKYNERTFPFITVDHLVEKLANGERIQAASNYKRQSITWWRN